METIDVRGLPEAMARAIAQTVEHLRAQLTGRKDGKPKTLPAWALGTKGSLRRDEIYDHLDGKV